MQYESFKDIDRSLVQVGWAVPLLILSWRGSCPPPPPPGSCVLAVCAATNGHPLSVRVSLRALALNCNARINSKEGAEAENWRGGQPVRVIRSYKLGKHSEYAPDKGLRCVTWQRRNFSPGFPSQAGAPGAGLVIGLGTYFQF